MTFGTSYAVIATLIGADIIRDEALNSLENLVLSFLTQLSGVLPSAYSQPQVPKLSERKIILHLANRSKESSEYVLIILYVFNLTHEPSLAVLSPLGR